MKAWSRKRSIFVRMAVFAALLSVWVISSPAATLVNGDFEDAGDYFTGWSSYTAQPSENTGTGVGGSTAVQYWIGAGVSQGWRGFYQRVSVSAGVEYEASINWSLTTWAVQESTIQLVMKWRDSGGGSLGQVSSGDQWSSQNGWTSDIDSRTIEISGVAPAGTVEVQYEIAVYRNSTAHADNDGYRFDNATLNTIVPEPATGLLFILSLALMGWRRRRRI